MKEKHNKPGPLSGLKDPEWKEMCYNFFLMNFLKKTEVLHTPTLMIVSLLPLFFPIP